MFFVPFLGSLVSSAFATAGGSGLTAGMSNAIAANTTTAAMNRKVLKVAKDIGC